MLHRMVSSKLASCVVANYQSSLMSHRFMKDGFVSISATILFSLVEKMKYLPGLPVAIDTILGLAPSRSFTESIQSALSPRWVPEKMSNLAAIRHLSFLGRADL